MSEFLGLLGIALSVVAGILSFVVVFAKDQDARDAAFRSAVLIFLMLIYGTN